MKTLELFSGTKSFSKVMESLGHETITIDNDPKLNPDICVDILTFDRTFEVDVIWASPPCQGFSVAAIGKNWNIGGTPKTESALLSIALVAKTMELIDQMKPTYWFIENPRAMLRKLDWFNKWVADRGGRRVTISYCQYGDTRMKPTDIWTNCIEWNPRPICKPRSDCHESAPRGSRTCTQGIKGAKDRGAIPSELFYEIMKSLNP